MTKPASRLHFLDAIRAFAIMMMLQGHFVHALLDDTYRDKSDVFYSTWEYLRGMTAPTFFTITGFIFTYLLLKQKAVGLDNPRVLKGIKRAVKVIFWGYLLRISFFALFNGTVNPSFFYVDVLQCSGTSLLLLIGVYLIAYRVTNRALFQKLVLSIGVVIFLLQPIYGSCILEFLPQTIANYFTNRNGSVFTLFPWFGYVCFGSFMATLFLKYGKREMFHKYAIISFLLIGLLLIFYSSSALMFIHNITGVGIFKSVAYNNFLFIRLGNVCVLFAVFMLLKDILAHQVITRIGGKTLSIYIIHFFVLYGSWFGLGLSRFFYHDLSPVQVIVGALLFVIGICALVLYYYKYEQMIKENTSTVLDNALRRFSIHLPDIISEMKNIIIRTYRSIKYARR
ncbi:heparan-alpha-glucosaminide N-acetyltransferase domain-containing protein [Aquimarina sp. AU474]|uniref:heparan-alpha-glucosaminide N-acetyltransferase domain-containing protein n=1 Tax=Aquimarina sp. AU474 TaxID=2108529 RepID=UPI000D687D9E|nr:heparan-alpha-glucosaminide N-acetyltransferase domain-containing protein [Aquimarina sp. AU474]